MTPGASRPPEFPAFRWDAAIIESEKITMYGIGIDTGGTYTDAVVYDFETNTVLAKGKSLTTKENLEIGIANSLDALPEELVRQAKVLSLSTTLATNACVEDKGGRARLVLLGTTDKVLKWVDAKSRYGLRAEDVCCIDTDGEAVSEENPIPGWYSLLKDQDSWLSDAQALAAADVPAMRNGAVNEKFVREKLRERFHVPFVMGSELAIGLNIMERGATALLNARLLPVVAEFLEAVRRVLEKRKLNITEMIVRSDGSLMSEAIAASYPVQTILSGPASSVIGARNLAKSDNCLIVDMGGTTTDISLVRNGTPEMSDRITIGGYKTQIQGVYIDTIGLGGDSRIKVHFDQLELDTRRVQPLCVAARDFPELIPQLEALVKAKKKHTLPLHEMLYLVREPAPNAGYTDSEYRLIDQLRDHPIVLGSGELDVYLLKTDRLEREGVIMRCGLTPTDIMHIRGDFDKYDKTASVLGATYVMHNVPAYKNSTLEQFCDDIYDMVCRKMYQEIVKILLQYTYPRLFSDGIGEQMEELVRMSWKEEQDEGLFGFRFFSHYSLIGIGAPTHIFLPRVAERMGVECHIAPHAEVANAVGAITADIAARAQLRISPIYSFEEEDAEYILYSSAGEVKFAELDEAIEAAKRETVAAAEADARRRGALGALSTEVTVDSNNACDKSGSTIELDTFVSACSRGRVYR